MREANQPELFERLKHSVQLLASPAHVQLKLLPDFVCKPDELALDFDNWRQAVVANFPTELTASQLNSLDGLDRELKQMCQDDWSDEAVIRGAKWQRIRDLASETLKAFGWPFEVPPGYSHELVTGARLSSNPKK